METTYTDYTPLMALANRNQNLLEEIGLFSAATTKYETSDLIEFERKEKGTTSMYNVERGADRQFAGDDGSRYVAVKTPYATLDKVTKPHEVQNFRKVGTKDAPEDVVTLVTQRVEHIQNSHALYIRDVQYRALTENKIYAFDKDGNEKVSYAKNYSTLWGSARGTGSIAYATATVDPFDALETARATVIAKAGDNASGYEIIYLVNTKQFSALISHAKVQAAYSQYESRQEPLRRRLGMTDQFSNNRVFDHKGVLVIEDISGKIADDKGYVIARGINDMFMSAYAPADLIEEAGKVAKPGYLWMQEGRRSVVIESDVAYVAMITRPELITDITATYV